LKVKFSICSYAPRYRAQVTKTNMSQSGSNPSKHTSSSSSSSAVDDSGHPRFTFVTEKNQPEARTHAMRAHWQERRRRNQHGEGHNLPRRLLRPHPKASGSRIAFQEVTIKHTTEDDQNQENIQHPGSYNNPFPVDGQQQYSPKSSDTMSYTSPCQVKGVPGQILSGLNFALGTSKLDPFDVFPVTLTTEHHKLIHHCISTLVCFAAETRL
jgi:hypothetical protein